MVFDAMARRQEDLQRIGRVTLLREIRRMRKPLFTAVAGRDHENNRKIQVITQFGCTRLLASDVGGTLRLIGKSELSMPKIGSSDVLPVLRADPGTDAFTAECVAVKRSRTVVGTVGRTRAEWVGTPGSRGRHANAV